MCKNCLPIGSLPSPIIDWLEGAFSRVDDELLAAAGNCNDPSLSASPTFLLPLSLMVDDEPDVEDADERNKIPPKTM